MVSPAAWTTPIRRGIRRETPLPSSKKNRRPPVPRGRRRPDRRELCATTVAGGVCLSHSFTTLPGRPLVRHELPRHSPPAQQIGPWPVRLPPARYIRPLVVFRGQVTCRSLSSESEPTSSPSHISRRPRRRLSTFQESDVTADFPASSVSMRPFSARGTTSQGKGDPSAATGASSMNFGPRRA